MRFKTPERFTLRKTTLSDGPPINALGRQSPDGGSVSVRSVFLENAFRSLKSLRQAMVGMVAANVKQKGSHLDL